MRIECEVCNATYTIDDAQLSDQPIGAQCPYCGHVKLVKRGDGAAAPAGAAPPPPPPSSMPGQVGPSDAFGGAPGSPFGGSPFGGNMPFGGGDATIPQQTAPPMQPPEAGGSLAADLSMPGAPVGDYAPPPGMTSGGGIPMDDVEGASCQVCGTPLTDEFDKVIGLCEAHQRDRRTGDVVDPARPSVASWHVRAQNGRVEGPMTLEDLRARVRSGELSPASDFSNDGVTFAPIGKFKEVAYLASLAVGGQVNVAPKSTYARPRRSMDLGRFVVPLLVLAVIGGLGFFAYTQRPLLERLYAGIVNPTTKSGPTGPNPLKRHIANLRLARPDVSGTASEHLVTAQARYLEDTEQGYQQAEKAYERALLLDEKDARAISGYVENLATWRFASTPPDERRIAEAAARYAAELEPDLPDPYRASGSLSLAQGDLHGCRAGADKAIEKDATDGRARLLLARCYLEGNVTLAISEATRARQLMPKLRVAERFLAEAYARTGRYASAIDVLEKRLEIDPDNAYVHLALGRVYQDVARTQDAAKHYKRAVGLPGDRQAALLALAALELEQGDMSGAIRHFDEAAKDRPVFGARASTVYGGWARAELSRRRASRAVQLAELALSHDAGDPVALLIRGEAALLTGSATTAQTYARRALDERPGEPSALVLHARALREQGQREAAIKVLETAIQNDPRDPRLKGILASVYLSMGASPQAYALMRRGAEIDPEEAHSRARKGPLGLSDTAVREAVEQFRRSATEERNASVASSSMGIMYYHLGDDARAKTAIERAIRIDGSNVAALLYDAQIALDRGDAKRAVQASQKMLAVERGTALGSLTLARAYVLQKKPDLAREHYGAALRSNPGLLSAKVELAALDLDGTERDAALAALQTAFRVNPNSLGLRKTLLEAGI